LGPELTEFGLDDIGHCHNKVYPCIMAYLCSSSLEAKEGDDVLLICVMEQEACQDNVLTLLIVLRLQLGTSSPAEKRQNALESTPVYCPWTRINAPESVKELSR
jgi:hypothetical protein